MFSHSFHCRILHNRPYSVVCGDGTLFLCPDGWRCGWLPLVSKCQVWSIIQERFIYFSKWAGVRVKMRPVGEWDLHEVEQGHSLALRVFLSRLADSTLPQAVQACLTNKESFTLLLHHGSSQLQNSLPTLTPNISRVCLTCSSLAHSVSSSSRLLNEAAYKILS